MTRAIFGDPNSKNRGWSISFSSPSRVMVAKSIGEVIPLLNTAEAEALAGNYVAVMLCYESAPAFDSALKTHEPKDLPLAWAAVFPSPSLKTDNMSEFYSASAWTPTIPRDEYNRAIEEIRELIARGATYQVNYTFPLVSEFRGEVRTYYHDLCLQQGAHYSAFLDLDDYRVLSLSPELFFERTGDVVRTRPMKGTVRRGRWSEEDKELAAWLADSEKDKAENVMIVDLLRNDLGKVSIPGSVKVSSLFKLERFETVWQMTSTVEARLRPQTSLSELMTALFPCGSVTGAPKIRTMEIIRQLEKHPRGPYTGTIGLMRPGGDCAFNVAIRTVVVKAGTGAASFGVGGGITIGSTADREYEECLVKARFLESKPKRFDLFETMLLHNGEVVLIARHLKRLQNSADYFGFDYPQPKIESAIEESKDKHQTGSWKIKLTVTKEGEISIVTSPVSDQGLELFDFNRALSITSEESIALGIAGSPVNSDDRLLFHKTTQRDLYVRELQARPDCEDLLFFNERDEITESTIANVVVEIKDRLFTPQVSAGLLAGTFRDQLIADGRIEERAISVDELKTVTRIFLINSVRGWMRGELKDGL